ncbi:deubiquitinase DESI2-like [Lolium rigidum]|uniref:deubiquitinase DESI2-like n=1 Tax=Lolium rigidum TaxID=89674 RepID=UPI001F5CAB81|nr:deubiquitinase DESI2-like [Lolium rigidum]
MSLQLQRSAAVSGKEPEMGHQQEVVAHVYDVACVGPDGAASGGGATVLHFNRIFKDAIGLGGIFHTAIQVYGDEEWSFGYCEHGSGVFSCPPCKNPMYTFRESIVLGKTSCSMLKVNHIARELSLEWPGSSYEILSRNCNHFCNEFCDKLDVPKLPGWINRFANAGDAALEAAELTAEKLKQAKKEIFTACKTASTYLTGAPSSTPSDVEDTGGSTSSSIFDGTWIRSIIGISIKPSRSLMNDPSSSSDDKTSDDESESDGKQPRSDQNEDQKDATQEQAAKSEDEPHDQP